MNVILFWSILSPDFITFFRHQVALFDYQHVSINNWVAQGGASQK
jgi:hypothetical protein